jgi:HAD superfamily hydrolase (TIGR01509 family)
MITSILWDNDGILVDTEHLYFQATREMLATVGVDLTEEAYRQLLLVEARGAWHLAEEKGVDADAIAVLKEARNERYGELLATEDIFVPGASEAVERLAPHFAMGIVTASRKDHFEIIHARTGFLPHFQCVVATGDYARSKPAPDPYLAGLERLGVTAEACVAVEDSLRGLLSARAAGLRCYAIPRGLSRDSDFSQAEGVLGSLAEFADILLGECA